MIRTFSKYLSTCLVLASVVGCSLAHDQNCGKNCGTTQESIDEFVRVGATFANDFNIILGSIDVQNLKDVDGNPVYGFPAGLYMQPAASDTSFGSLLPFERRKLYLIDYSRESSTGVFDKYLHSNGLDVNQLKPELHISSDYTLSLSKLQNIPVNYTHAELWYRESEGSEYQLVRRVELRELWMWRKYILGEDI